VHPDVDARERHRGGQDEEQRNGAPDEQDEHDGASEARRRVTRRERAADRPAEQRIGLRDRH